MRVRCPHCADAVDVDDGTPLGEIDCPFCGSSFSLLSDDTMTFRSLTSKTIGQFELLTPLGSGSFGSVWKARDTHLDRFVAIKIPRKGQLTSEELEKFMREARAAARLKHPRIVSVHEVGRESDLIYIVSDFVEGVALRDWLTGRRPTHQETAVLCQKIAEALEHAHQCGVIHRDLKPGNIMLDAAGEPHIMDFGLAKRVEASEVTMTVDGQVLGTPAYMSPEQARGEGHRADGRMDIYSLGVVMYELLTGERPFRGNARMILHQVMHEEPTAPRRLNATIPRDLETICLTCLEKKPERRYAHASDLVADLQRWQRHEPISVRPLGRIGRTWRWAQRNPALATMTSLAALSLLIATIVAAAFGWHQWRTANALAEQKGLLDVALGDAVKAQSELAQQRNAARDQALLAEQKSQEAQAAQIAALNAERLTQQQLDRIQRLLYATDMSLADQSLAEGGKESYAQARTLLARYAAGSPQENTDLQSFEWRHLMRRCYGYRTSLYEDAVFVTDVACSHDGRYAAFVLSGDGWIDNATNEWVQAPDETRLVDLTTLQEVRRLPIAPGRVLDVFFGSGTLYEMREPVDGHGAADNAPEGDDSNEVQNAEPWRRIQTAVNQWGRVPLASKPVVIRSWDLTSGQQLRALHLSDGGASRTVSPDGNQLAVFRSGAFQQDIRVYDLQADVPPRTVWSQNVLTVGNRTPIAIQFPAADTLTLLTIYSTFVESARTVGSLIAGETSTLRRGCDLVTIDLTRARPRGVIALPGDFTDHVLFPPREDQLVTIDLDGQVHVRDRESGQVRHSYIPLESRVRSAVLSPDGNSLAVAVANRCLVFDLADVNQPRKLQGHLGDVHQLVFAPDGQSLISAGSQGARIWDAPGLVAENSVRLQGFGGNLAFTRDGSTLYATIRTTGGVFGQQLGISEIALQDTTATLRDIHWSGENSRGHMWLSADDSKVVLQSDDGVTVAHRDSMQPVFSIPEAPWRSAPLAVSSKTSTIAVTVGQRQIKVYDLNSGELQSTFAAHKNVLTSLAYLPDGRTLVTGDQRGEVWTWDPATGTSERGISFDSACTHLLPTGDSNVMLAAAGAQLYWWHRGEGRLEALGDRRRFMQDVKLSPDGRTLAASTTESVWLMDPQYGQNRIVLKRPGHMPAALAFSPNGDKLAVAWNPAGDRNILLPMQCVVSVYLTRAKPPQPALPAKTGASQEE